MKIDRNTPVPLYYQLKQHFLEQINSGTFGVGDRLPSEEEVIDQSGLSRFTVRQAFAALEREGLVERTRGKGTFVKAPRVPLALAWQLIGFSDDMTRQGRTVSTEVAEISIQPCAVEDAVSHLNLRIDDEVVHIRRVRRVDGFPILWDSISIPVNLVPGMEKLNLTDQSIVHILEEKYSVKVARAHRTLRIGPANADAADFLDIEPGSSVFVLDDLAFGENDVPVYFARAEISPRRTQFEFELAVDPQCQTVMNSAHPVIRDTD